MFFLKENAFVVKKNVLNVRSGNNIVDIKINGLTKAQEMAVEDFFSKVQNCIDGKSSHWVAIFADGKNEWKDINIQVNGKAPQNCTIPEKCNRWWNLFFKEAEDKYTPEPFYLAESYTIEEDLKELDASKNYDDEYWGVNEDESSKEN